MGVRLGVRKPDSPGIQTPHTSPPHRLWISGSVENQDNGVSKNLDAFPFYQGFIAYKCVRIWDMSVHRDFESPDYERSLYFSNASHNEHLVVGQSGTVSTNENWLRAY